MRNRIVPTSALALILALGPLAFPPTPARASIPSLRTLAIPSVVTLPVAQAEEEHDHGEGFESDPDPWRNLAAPLIMVAAGLLYLGFVRWKVRRQRGHGAAHG